MTAMDHDRLDWAALANKIDSLESGGTEVGRKAIIELLGEPLLAGAVDFYVDYPDAFQVAQSVIDLLQPEICRQRCLEIYATETRLSRRRGAVELLATVGDRSTLPWVTTFLSDKDESIQGLGASVLDALVWRERIEPEEAEQLICLAETSDSTSVREAAVRIRKYLKERAELQK
jgi:hypothetical protein